MNDRKHPLAHCEVCPMREDGEYVPSEGPTEASLAIVGESPGYGESISGRPFTGPSGRLLNAVLQGNGIIRREIFLTNAALCRNPNGDNASEATVKACRPRLIAELQNRNVDTVITLGNIATKAILGKDGITKLRVGRPKSCSSLDGVKVIPTFHPASALRVASQFPYIVTDFRKINSVQKLWNPPQFDVVDSELEAIQQIEKLRNSGKKDLVIDIETSVEKDTSFEQSNRTGLLCIGICYDTDRVLIFGESCLQSREVCFQLGELLRSSRVIAHNGKFDLKGLYSRFGDIKLHFDTMLASYILDERQGTHSLEYLGLEILGTPDWKHDLDPWNPKKFGYQAIPKPILYQYNAYDCAVTWSLWVHFEKIIAAKPEFKSLMEFLCQASDELKFVEMNGIGIDIKYLNELDEQFERELGMMEIEMNLRLRGTSYDKTGGVNPRSPLQLKRAFADFGVTLPSTDAENLAALIERCGLDTPVGKFAAKLLDYRKMQKDHGTYVKGIAERLYKGRVYPNFLLHGTTAGRLSCRNPNLQNIPRKVAVKRLFIPVSNENVFVQADYSQAELRILSWLAGDTYFRDIFNEGKRDIFDELSQNVLFPEYPKETTDKELYKDLRVRVKAYVYGLSYGRTEYGVSNELGISLSEALEGMNKFFQVIPEIVHWQKMIKFQVESGNDLVSPFGRHRRFMLITQENHDETIREALSFMPQSTSSDVCLRAAINLRKELRGIGWIRNIVHDSILVECRQDSSDEVSRIMEERMLESGQELVGDFVKFAVDTKVGNHWGEV